jgi:hypothetical protein
MAYTLTPEEKKTSVMVYTANMLINGEAITRETMRVSTWLRTQGAPEFVHLLNAKVLIFGAGSVHSMNFSEYFIPTPQILAFHMTPPAKDPPDYDESEPNRKMEPSSVVVGTFRMNGNFRIASQSDLAKMLEVTHSSFLSFYEVEISSASLPAMGVMRVAMAIVRPTVVCFGSRT